MTIVTRSIAAAFVFGVALEGYRSVVNNLAERTQDCFNAYQSMCSLNGRDGSSCDWKYPVVLTVGVAGCIALCAGAGIVVLGCLMGPKKTEAPKQD